MRRKARRKIRRESRAREKGGRRFDGLKQRCLPGGLDLKAEGTWRAGQMLPVNGLAH